MDFKCCIAWKYFTKIVIIERIVSTVFDSMLVLHEIQNIVWDKANKRSAKFKFVHQIKWHISYSNVTLSADRMEKS